MAAATLIFMGTPEYAVPSLDALLAAGFKISAVYCQGSRPAGRGRRMVAPRRAVARWHRPVGHGGEGRRARGVVAAGVGVVAAPGLGQSQAAVGRRAAVPAVGARANWRGIADRGDGCTWVEGFRLRSEAVGLEVSLFTDCPAGFFFDFRPDTGEILLAME